MSKSSGAAPARLAERRRPSAPRWVGIVLVCMLFVLMAFVSSAASRAIDLPFKVVIASIVAASCFTAYSVVLSILLPPWHVNLGAAVFSAGLIIVAYLFVPDPAPAPPADLSSV